MEANKIQDAEQDLNTSSDKSEKEKRKKEKRENKIKELKRLFEEKTKETEENYQRFLRARAETENIKRMAEREKADIIKYSNEELIKELVPVLDNLERALHHSNETDDTGSLRDGVKLTLDALLKALKMFGLEQISVLDDRFDPSKHEAVAIIESSEHEDSTIIQEFQKAYFLKERLLRPARVAVSRLPDKGKKAKTQRE